MDLLICVVWIGIVAFSSYVDSDADDAEQYVLFWKADSPFSQWYSCRFTVDGTVYNCAEQFMMQQKACEFHFTMF